MKCKITLLLFLTSLFSIQVEAKKYPFKIDTPREVVISRSSKAGTKIVEVTAYGRTTDKAIEQAMMDAVVSLSFWGASGYGEMENCPAILFEGRTAYDRNKTFFNKFFKQGIFMSYVKRINSTYPMGRDNVKTSKGRRIQILLLVDWNGLANYYKKSGLKTIVSELGNY